MKKIAILYSTTDGHTINICNQISKNLQELGCTVNLFEISSFKNNISDYTSIIIGASIRYGKHNKVVTQFIQTHKEAFRKIKTSFFSVNLVARKSDKNTYDSNPYVVKYFNQLDWKPDVIDVFAGRLDYNSYSFIDRLMIKLIMKITNGPTKSDKPIVFTNWERVKEFSSKIYQA